MCQPRRRRGTRNLDHGAPGTSLHVVVRLHTTACKPPLLFLAEGRKQVAAVRIRVRQWRRAVLASRSSSHLTTKMPGALQLPSLASATSHHASDRFRPQIDCSVSALLRVRGPCPLPTQPTNRIFVQATSSVCVCVSQSSASERAPCNTSALIVCSHRYAHTYTRWVGTYLPVSDAARLALRSGGLITGSRAFDVGVVQRGRLGCVMLPRCVDMYTRAGIRSPGG